MRIDVLASGSDGNCTAAYVGGKSILLDSGKPLTWTLQKLSWKLPHAILITHEHGDHAKSANQFLERAVDVYATAGTIAALKLDGNRNQRRLHKITVGEEFKVAGVTAKAIPSAHDAAEPVNFILSDGEDRLLYATDTGTAPEVDGDFTKIILEANHSRKALLLSSVDENQKRRVLENHLSIERAVEFLQAHRAAEVHLIHISKRHGNMDGFKAQVILQTGIQNVSVN